MGKASKFPHFLLVSLFLLLGWGEASATEWRGPVDGPPREIGRSVVYIAFDLKNGGIVSVYRGLQEAARLLGWTLTAIDGKGDAENLPFLFGGVIEQRPDAIILGGFGPEMAPSQIAAAQAHAILLAGWHAAPLSGPIAGLFINITTNPETVAREAVEAVIGSSDGPIGVILFNDSSFSIANLKTEAMKKALLACGRCEILAVEDIPIANANEAVGKVVRQDNAKFGRRWTHSLAINDIYFDNMNYALHAIGREDISNVSAGDGSDRALGRIRSGRSRQLASVAEPLTLQAWQLADELNRAFAGLPPSGTVSSPILVTEQLLRDLGDRPIDSGIPFKERYRGIWLAVSDR